MAEQQNRVPFGPEINRMLDAMLTSFPLPGMKYIFLSELIRDAYRNLRMIRDESVIDMSKLGDEPNLFIQIVPDKNSKTLSIIDTGIGMTHKDLVDLGTIDSEGLQMDITMRMLDEYLEPDDHFEFFPDDPEFFQKKAEYLESGDPEYFQKKAIGGADALPMPFLAEFGGFGFYSAYLAAEKVVVTTKNNDDVQYVWESEVTREDGGYYTITEDTITSGNKLTRGTKVTLFLKKDYLEYLEEHKLKGLADFYSRVYRYPIFLGEKKKVDASEADEEEIKLEEKKQEFECFRKIIKDILDVGDGVKDVVVDDRFKDLDCFMTVDMVMHINPTSPIIEDLRKRAEANKDDETVVSTINIMYDTCHADILSYDVKTVKYKTSHYKSVYFE